MFSQIQSCNEGDLASHTRVNNTTPTGFKVKVEEQNDTAHTAETIGYIAMEPTTLKSGAAKVEETKYYPYGVIQEGGSEKYLYTGKELDQGTGLYYYEARYYNPNVGRFIQPDTIISDLYNPQSLNRYSYVLNNPLRYVDPSGHLCEKGLIVSGVITTIGVGIAVAGAPIFGAPLAIGIGVHMALLGGVTGIGSVVLDKSAEKDISSVQTVSLLHGVSEKIFAVASIVEGGNTEEALKDTQLANDAIGLASGVSAATGATTVVEFGVGTFEAGYSGYDLYTTAKEKLNDEIGKVKDYKPPLTEEEGFEGKEGTSEYVYEVATTPGDVSGFTLAPLSNSLGVSYSYYFTSGYEGLWAPPTWVAGGYNPETGRWGDPPEDLED